MPLPKRPAFDTSGNWSRAPLPRKNAHVRIHKLSDADGFIAIDLDNADRTIGIVRRAKKVLQGGAKDLARSLTYGFGVHELKYSGASAGLSGFGEGSEGLIEAFQTEVGPMVESGAFLPDIGKGISKADLAPLLDDDPRPALRLAERNGLTLQDELVGHSVAAASAAALGGLDGKRVSIEGFDVNGLAVARALVASGAVIVGASTADGSIQSDDALDIEAFAAALVSGDEDALANFGDVNPANRIFGHGVDAITVASKMGVCNHYAAEYVKAKAIVPAAGMVVTAKALAMLRKADVLVMPDFVSIGGPIPLWSHEGDIDADTAVAAAVDTTTAICTEALAHEDGPLLGACYKAEAFLGSWQDTLPFGRPLAP